MLAGECDKMTRDALPAVKFLDAGSPRWHIPPDAPPAVAAAPPPPGPVYLSPYYYYGPPPYYPPPYYSGYGFYGYW